MFIYQISLGILMFNVIIRCETMYAKGIGLAIWFLLAFMQWVIYYERKKMTPYQRRREIMKQMYNIRYFNNFGKLP